MASRGVVDIAKEEALRAMYNSVDRMNKCIMNHALDKDLSGTIVSEQHLQENLRGNFEDLQKSEEPEV